MYECNLFLLPVFSRYCTCKKLYSASALHVTILSLFSHDVLSGSVYQRSSVYFIVCNICYIQYCVIWGRDASFLLFLALLYMYMYITYPASLMEILKFDWLRQILYAAILCFLTYLIIFIYPLHVTY